MLTAEALGAGRSPGLISVKYDLYENIVPDLGNYLKFELSKVITISCNSYIRLLLSNLINCLELCLWSITD